MKIKLTIFNPAKKRNGKHGVEPDIYEYKGNYALETMIIKIIEEYFGPKISDSVEALLKVRIEEE